MRRIAVSVDPILHQLSGLLLNQEVTARLAPMFSRLDQTGNRELPQVLKPLDLDIFGPALPDSIKSCWLFVLRAAAVFGAERHPNSHQRSFALQGSAFFEVFKDGRWAAAPIDSAGSEVETRSISIPQGVWHRIKIGSEHFASLSFHTVPASQLIEETPVENDLSVTKQRLYHA